MCSPTASLTFKSKANKRTCPQGRGDRTYVKQVLSRSYGKAWGHQIEKKGRETYWVPSCSLFSDQHCASSPDRAHPLLSGSEQARRHGRQAGSTWVSQKKYVGPTNTPAFKMPKAGPPRSSKPKVGPPVQFHPNGRFWVVVTRLNDSFAEFGYAIVGLFALSWLVSMAVYKWRGFDKIEITQKVSIQAER